MDVTKLIADVYVLDQVKHETAAAVASLRNTAAQSAEVAAALRAELLRLQAVVAAREHIGRNGCHISKVTADLLAAAFR